MEIRDEQQYLRTRERIHRDTAESAGRPRPAVGGVRTRILESRNSGWWVRVRRPPPPCNVPVQPAAGPEKRAEPSLHSRARRAGGPRGLGSQRLRRPTAGVPPGAHRQPVEQPPQAHASFPSTPQTRADANVRVMGWSIFECCLLIAMRSGLDGPSRVGRKAVWPSPDPLPPSPQAKCRSPNGSESPSRPTALGKVRPLKPGVGVDDL